MNRRARRDWGQLLPLALLLCACAVFGLLSHQFFEPANLVNILVQSSSVAIVAIGMTLVLLTGGIDLSVGSIMFLAAAVAGKMVLASPPAPVPLAVAAILPLGFLFGTVNALFIANLRLMPFVVTLATLYVGRGLALGITQTRAMNLPDDFLRIGQSRLLHVPFPIVLLVIVAVLTHLVLTQTPFGRQLYALGHDPEAARKAGIRVRRLTAAVYILSGLCAALGGIVSVAELGAVSPTFGYQREFAAIAAAVLGGTSLFGGRGSVLPGTVVGAILIQTIENGLVIVNANPYAYPVVTATVIFIAVLSDRLRTLGRPTGVAFQAETIHSEDSRMKRVLFMFLALAALARPVSAGELAGYKFLITSVRTGDTEIFEVDPDMGDARNITRSPSSEDRYPCWSPDGRQIAFTSNRALGTYNLFVCDANGSNVRQLTRETGTSVAYMPSWVGDRIVFGLHRDKPRMASIKPDGSDLKVLGEGHDPCLSPDGKHIAYTGEVPGGVSVFVMNADGSNKHQIVKDVNPWGAIFPSWSPDGKQIVYSFKVGESLELFIVDADGSAPPRQLTHLGKVCTPAAWSPDGKWISFRYTDEMYWRNKARMEQVYAHPQGDKRPVWVIRRDGSDAHIIEPLRYQCAMDGSRAAWKPMESAPAKADARYFNLRIYDVTPGKLDAVAARFRDHVGPIRAKHGIQTLGYWTEKASDGKQKFIYLMAGPDEATFCASEKSFSEDPDFRAAYAASEKENGKTVNHIASYPLVAVPSFPPVDAADLRGPQAFELRIYDVAPGRLEALLGSYREARLPLFLKYGLMPRGLWTSLSSDVPQRLVLLLGGQSGRAIQEAKTAYHADPEWRQNVDAADQAAGTPPIVKVESHILTPLDLSQPSAH